MSNPFIYYDTTHVDTVRMNEKLCGTPLTGETLKSALAEVLQEAAENLNAVSAERIGDGKGFLSDILSVSLSWKNEVENVGLPSSVVVKLPTMEQVVGVFKDTSENVEEKAQRYFQLDELFRKESAAYNVLSKELSEFPLPRCYCIWDKENDPMSLLVLQDLSKTARTADLVNGLTEDQLLNCVEAIAKLQAWSLTTKCDWKSFASVRGTLLDKIAAYPKAVVRQLKRIVEKYPMHFGSLSLEDIGTFMEDKDTFAAELMSYREVMPDVFVHGDYRASNILFKVDDETNTTSSHIAAIIDWQTVHQGSFAEDICYLMMFNVNIGLRRSKMKDIVRFYFRTMKTLVPTIMDSVSFDSVWHIFEKTLPWLTVFYTPYILKLSLPACRNEPMAESAVVSNLAEGYKDAVNLNVEASLICCISASTMNKPLCGTKLTGEILEQALVAAGKAAPGSLDSVSAEKIGNCEGYMSDILRVFLVWKECRKTSAYPNKILVKMPKQDSVDILTESFDQKLADQIKQSVKVDILTRIECAVYRMFSKEAPEIPIPKCYAVCTKEENPMVFIAMEDLSPRAETPDITSGLTKGQLINCAEALAALQAWSFNTPYEWKKEVPDMLTHADRALSLLGSIEKQLQVSIKKYPAHFKCVDAKKISAALCDREKTIAAMTAYKKLVPDVLVHGDFWANNILFEVDNKTNSVSDRIAAIIDWQVCHQGSFAEDLARLYSYSVDADVRRSTMMDVFRHYFDKMKMWAPGAISSVPFEIAYHIFENAVFHNALMLICLPDEEWSISSNVPIGLSSIPLTIQTRRARYKFYHFPQHALTMNVPLCGTDLTGEKLEQAFVAAGKVTPGSLESVTAEKIHHSGGHTSDMLRVFLFWKEKGETATHPARILVKIPKQEHIDKLTETFDSKLAEKVREIFNVNKLARIESSVYRMLSKEVPAIPIPKCYTAWNNEENSRKFLAIEDLSPHAKTTGLTRSLTKGQLINCAETLAALQAWSLSTQCEWRKELPDLDWFIGTLQDALRASGKQLEESVKKYPTHLKCVDVEKVCSILSNREKLIAVSISALIVRRSNGLQYKRYCRRALRKQPVAQYSHSCYEYSETTAGLRVALETMHTYLFYVQEMTEFRKVIPDVFVHGDFWANNILFEVDNKTNSVSDRIAGIIDWQLSHQGSFAEDLSRLYSINVDPEVRRSTMKEVFFRYFEKMQMLAPERMNSITFESAYYIFKRAICYHALMMVTFANQLPNMADGNPAIEAALLNRTVENYKDAAKFFNF
ncbi:hypothetical protein M513_03415 [Trichuris suis]|uniref:CHK kinase-like domain-containing protein n=1 Tax=Trichuris suis TaxID=68888 RepID=A0A085MEM1_9BILA|nr:hypothetical protein M513_03415 [Trichuris suis]